MNSAYFLEANRGKKKVRCIEDVDQRKKEGGIKFYLYASTQTEKLKSIMIQMKEH